MHPELKAQTEVAEKHKDDRSFIDPANFYESERNSGYKNTGNALYEIIDNAYEANASKIFITAKNKPGTNQPEQIAVIDDGTGMPKDFLHTACKIGGTHRPSADKPLKRKGYGRFGHGLPKSSISQTRSFSVFTKNEDDQKWRGITVDIDELIAANTPLLPLEQEIDKLPDYIQECLDKNFKDSNTGTIVAWNKCDRMTWKTEDAISQNLSWRISMSYWRNIKSGLQISVLGNPVSPIDPLFVDKGCEHVESCGSNNLQAKEIPTWTWPFKVKSEGKEEIIEAEVRMSIFPPRFGSKDVSAQKILVGDLNIAPLENDVWSHKQLLNVVSHTPLETETLLEIINTGEWVDVMREIFPHNEKLYSWWSYRNRNWEISNRGRRLDHVWVSKKLFPQVKSGVIFKDTRSWERPSDHVPIIIDIDI